MSLSLHCIVGAICLCVPGRVGCPLEEFTERRTFMEVTARLL